MYYPIQDVWATLSSQQKDTFIAEIATYIRDCFENDCENPGGSCNISDENTCFVNAAISILTSEGTNIVCHINM